MATKAKITCLACGCSKVVVCQLSVQDVVLEHESSCPFYAAVRKGTAEQWVAENGYPIETHDSD